MLLRTKSGPKASNKSRRVRADNKNKIYLVCVFAVPAINSLQKWFMVRLQKGCDIWAMTTTRELFHVLNYPITEAIGITSFVFLEPHLRTYDVYF